MTRGTSRDVIARAALESVGYQTRDLVEAMTADAGATIGVIRVDGGMAASDWTMQFVSDMLGVPVDRPANLEFDRARRGLRRRLAGRRHARPGVVRRAAPPRPGLHARPWTRRPARRSTGVGGRRCGGRCEGAASGEIAAWRKRRLGRNPETMRSLHGLRVDAPPQFPGAEQGHFRAGTWRIIRGNRE